MGERTRSSPGRSSTSGVCSDVNSGRSARPRVPDEHRSARPEGDNLRMTPSLISEYEAAFPDWGVLFSRARHVLAGGVSHDVRLFKPFPAYMERATGAFKRDASGRQFIDYWMGHGSLLLGHSFPPVVKAIAKQARSGMHLGACTELEIRWAEQVQALVPSAERVRFTSSGTEAVMLAIRVARAATGRTSILVLDGHFHGWHDDALALFVAPRSSGIPQGTRSRVVLGSQFDPMSVIERLERHDLAAVILEPGGGGSGALPLDPGFLSTLREGTEEAGTLLLFDETVTGFRTSPGGVQKATGVVPDLTVLGKILAGGLPGAALAGRRPFMDVFGLGVRIGRRWVRVPHTGTFNANPLSAAAGTAMLEHVADSTSQIRAREAANLLVRLSNEAARDVGVDVTLHTDGASIVHLRIGGGSVNAADRPSASTIALFARYPKRYAALRRALLIEGVDMHPMHGWVSAVHDREVIAATVAAFRRAFHRVAT